MKPLFHDVIVNGEIIAADRIAAEAQNHPAPPGKPGLAWKAAARALAVRSLLLQEARRRALRPDPQDIAPGQREAEDEALIRQVLDLAVRPAQPTEAALEAQYAANPGRFCAPTLYEAAHILIAPGDDPHQARHLAETLLAAVLADPGRFDGLARQHSACGSKASGGRLGQIATGDTVAEFETTLAGMTEGQINPALVRSRYGWHIIRLDARAPGRVLPYPAIRTQLRIAQEKVAWMQASRDFIASLVAGASISGVTLSSA